MKRVLWMVMLLSMAGSMACARRGMYEEKYRPQFHFSAQSGWLGDPDGPLLYDGKYHVFWWGHATSPDLLHWDDMGWAMLGDDGSFGYYSGCVVVDKDNTSGFGVNGIPPMVAIYTMHEYSTGIQRQGLSYSQNYRNFRFWDGNPVIDSTSKDFRDPQIFWDEVRGRWVMVIARPPEKKLEFYYSPNLKDWTYMGEFGNVGAQQNAWEVPDLLQMPLDGDPKNLKWVLICGVGPNKTQYFVGEFTGTTFVLDPTMKKFLDEGAGVPGEVFEDFEKGYGDWKTTGEAFGDAPARGALPTENPVTGYFDDHLANSFHGGDDTKGTMTSREFTIEKPFVNFLIGGGAFANKTELQLLIDGEIVRSIPGPESESLRWRGWDVRDLIGKTACIRAIDDAEGGWGHILLDEIRFSDTKLQTDREQTYWADWGNDFYATKTFRDFDGTEDRTIWIAWMNCWDYANSIPTTWGGSTAHSIPRELRLVTSETQGFQILQQPIEELKTLRKDRVHIENILLNGTSPISGFSPSRNTYEIDATFRLTTTRTGHYGLNLCIGDGKQLVVGFDEASSEIYVNRANANGVEIPNFNIVSRGPVETSGNSIRIHIFVDQLSVEVFVDDGATVLTSLIFPSPEALGVEVFSSNGAVRLEELNAWELKSIWNDEYGLIGWLMK
ncbi:GH32 C-terminal domain-containing protein [bacterium]|nr:GH32 C-terminal domain-containing protein [bacterium]